MNNQEIVGFICKTCKKELAIGTCGTHREETNHKEFESVYDSFNLNNEFER